MHDVCVIISVECLQPTVNKILVVLRHDHHHDHNSIVSIIIETSKCVTLKLKGLCARAVLLLSHLRWL